MPVPWPLGPGIWRLMRRCDGTDSPSPDMTYLPTFTVTSVSSPPFAQHCLILSPLHDHVRVLMGIHSTQFGNQLLQLHWSSSLQFVDQVLVLIARVANKCT